MESRDIYNRSRKTIQWEPNWVHIGTGNLIKKELIENSIIEHFEHQEYIMIKRGRRNSRSIQTRNAMNEIVSLIGNDNFELWNGEFSKAIKFDKIGVMRKSKYAI